MAGCWTDAGYWPTPTQHYDRHVMPTDDDFSLRDAAREIRDAVSERVDACNSPSPAAIGALAAASHAARPIVFLYVIYIILLYAPFALLES
ncbi:hypothetical protein OPT61_g9384 [Boeremia exigua]|uniref:Uncharacterized protein n=1 Tax=Boeremia exigua TaxID=749465 RepID=A0ACC2HUK4_9PLEO|nr:hypothetical protein OPT61_g9384 [Boeremia exigua]